VQHLIAELIKTTRPSSAVHASCCFPHRSITAGRTRSTVAQGSGGGEASDTNGRGGFTSAPRQWMPTQDLANHDSDALELEEPLLDGDSPAVDQGGSLQHCTDGVEHCSEADTRCGTMCAG
jgi:hypothetical protein